MSCVPTRMEYPALERLRAIDICCGGGGWACAARELPIDIVLAVDWWETACVTYRLNHPETVVIRADAKTPFLATEHLRGNVDLVLGGIPCEWISSLRMIWPESSPTAAEIDRERALLDAVLQTVREIDPPYWCLEDVVELRRELPILTRYVVLDSRHWSGQRRKRIYVGRFPVPPRADDRRLFRDYLRPGPYRVGRRLYGREPVLCRSFSHHATLAGLPDRKAPTVVFQGSRRDAEMGIVRSDEPADRMLRQIEWQESAALQGFPSDYLFYGSPTDVSVMIGRSVQIDTARAILTGICRQAGLVP